LTTAEILHDKYNERSDQIEPCRIKRFKRNNLAKLFGEMGYQTGAEVGVAEGYYSRVICQNVKDVKLYCVDLWDTYYRGTAKLKNRRMQDEAYAEAVQNLKGYNTTLIRQASMEAVSGFPDESLDFVYLDGDHSFDYIMMDLIMWSKKVRPGGIVSGHDYYRFRGAGVVDAVDVYTKTHGIREWFVCDEHEKSFFWAKP